MLLAVTALIVLAVLARRRRRQDHAPARIRAARADSFSAAALLAGYAAAGPAGLVDAATVAAVGVLVVARAAWPGQEIRSVRTIRRRGRVRTPAVSAAEFPAYRKITADLSWGLAAGPRAGNGLGRRLTRLAAALGRPAPRTPWTRGGRLHAAGAAPE